MDTFIGIDVAFAKRKRLPVAAVRWEDGALVPWPLADRQAPEPPRGHGNVAALDSELVDRFADDVACFLFRLETHFGFRISRIAIDAPSEPRAEGLARRKAEACLDERRISCFTTPSASELDQIRQKAREHLAAGGAVARLPHANQLWMFVGFALFARLRRTWECLEVFPQATAHVLGASGVHKSQADGLAAQVQAAAKHTRWPRAFAGNPFKEFVHGPAHDGLDAYLAAWVAALDASLRAALGVPPNDVIYVPKVEAAAASIP